MNNNKNIFLGICALLLCITAVVYITFPLLFHMTDYVSGELVIAWIMNWDMHAIMHHVWTFFDANIFYPYHNTLAYSDLFLSSSILALPFFIFFREPMLASNITFFSSLVLLGFFTYLLTKYITNNFFASLISGMLVIFSPTVLDKQYHLQHIALEWIPLSLLFLLYFSKTKSYKYLVLSLLCFVVQTYNSFLAGYFLLFCYAGIISTYAFFDKKILFSFFTKKVLVLFLFSLLLIAPLCIPYFQVSYEFHFVRDIRETIHLALQPEDLLVTNTTSRLLPFLQFFDRKNYPSSAEIKPGFLGGVFSLLSGITIIYVLLRKRIVHKKKNTLLIAFFRIACVGLLLSFGPLLHIGRVTIHHPFPIPLPYALAYYVLPGFQGFRDSSTFEMLYILTMAVAIGIAISEMLQYRKPVLRYSIYLCICIAIVAECNGMQFAKAYTFENFPPVYSWINTHTSQEAVIAELPVYNWDNNPFGDNREVLREYFSTLHFRYIISGGSGFSPFPWQNFAKKVFADFPSEESIMRIHSYGATYLVVHGGEFDALHAQRFMAGNHVVYSGATVISQLSKETQLRFLTKQGNDYVYAYK